MMRIFSLFAFVVLLSACVPPETSSTDSLPGAPVRYETEEGAVVILPASAEDRTPAINRSVSDRCGANSLQAFVGQPETVFFRYTFPEGTRFIRPGDAVTQDFVARRINFILGNDGRVRQVRCG